jgi:hypothetical protein
LIGLTAKFNAADEARVRLKLRRLPKVANKIIQRAANHGVRKGSTLISKGIRTRLNLKAAAVNGRMQKVFAKRVANKQEAAINIYQKPVSLIEFGARQTKKGVTFKLFKRTGMLGKKNKQREKYRHAFIASAKGRRHVWLRVDAAGKPRFGEGSRIKPPGQPDTPLRLVRGPSVKRFYENRKGMRSKHNAQIRRLMLKEAMRLARVELKRKGL